jgi:hypothetical protein
MVLAARHCGMVTAMGHIVMQKQIPCGNDRKKNNSNNRFPAGMTERKTTATTDSLRE